MAPSSLYVPSGLSPDEDGMGGGFLEAGYYVFGERSLHFPNPSIRYWLKTL
jgi:hypothetical protein